MSTTTAPSFQAKLPPCSFVPPRYEGPSREQVLKDRREFLSPGLITYYKEPLMLVDGWMQYLFDEAGRRYLDLFAGIVSVSCGHSHPKIIKRVQEQVARLCHTTTIYVHPNVAELGKKLAAKLPGDLKVAYFVNSGSEANDLAMLMARLYTGNRDVVGLRNCYHGASGITMGLTSHHTWKYAATPKDDIYHAACPDPYRSLFKGSPAEVAAQSVEDLRDLIKFSTSGKLAAFIAEPIQGVGGTTYGAPEYLPAAYKVVREHGGLCIADEVQTGFGRTGDHYWGFQNSGVSPDIVTMAKSLGNGITVEQLFSGDHPLLAQAYSPMTLRFFMLQAHYRGTLDFSNDALQAAEKGLQRLWNAAEKSRNLKASSQNEYEVSALAAACTSAMNDDLNTPQVIAQLFEAARVSNLAHDGKLALDAANIQALQALFHTWMQDILGLKEEQSADNDDLDAVMQVLLDLRAKAKSEKNFALSDAIRDQLSVAGFSIKDGKEGSTWSKN